MSSSIGLVFDPMFRHVAAVLVCLLPSLKAAEFFEQTDLFRQGDLGVHTYRIPALVETRRGTVIAVVDARHDNDRDLPGRIDLVIRRSFDRGETWSKQTVLRSVEEGGVGDASLLSDLKSGRIWCFHAYGPPGIGFSTAKPGERTGINTLQLHAMHSDDDGQTWSTPTDLTPQVKDPSWQAVFVTSGTHFATSRNRYIVPLVVKDAHGLISSRNAYSDDAGITWRPGHAIGADTDESHAIELMDGAILQNMRNGKTRAVARSSDGGATFGPVSHDAALIDPSCNAGLARYRRGRTNFLIFTNAASTKRENLTVKLSADEGKTWTCARTIHSGPAAYSAVIVMKDGTIGVLYERGDARPAEKITFARFNLDWVKSGNPAR